jgi:hypothetical protein
VILDDRPPNSPASWHRFQPDRPELLSSTSTRWKKLIFLLVFALFWNGIVFGIGVTVFSDRVLSLAGCFLAPFMLVGIGLLVYVVYLILALFNPTTLINVSGQAAYAAGELGIGWRISGRAGRLTRLRILFEGRESATYRRGTSTTTDTKPFLHLLVFESDKVEEFEAGQATVDLSSVVMPTFISTHNKIQYFLHVQGEISNWPDIDDEFEIDIWPTSANQERP